MEKPEQVFQAGAIQASVFVNERDIEGKKVKMRSVSFHKSYMDKGEWKTTSTLNADDLPKVIYVLIQAYSSIMQAD
jgi:hypothetical protein